MLDPRPDATISDQVTVVLGILCFLLTTGIIVYFVVRRLRHQRKKLFAICIKSLYIYIIYFNKRSINYNKLK